MIVIINQRISFYKGRIKYIVASIYHIYNLILTGSRVKQLTPFPVDNTITVALPYNAYPAATIAFPGCKPSFCDGLPDPSS